jgi:hypothetical protein
VRERADQRDAFEHRVENGQVAGGLCLRRILTATAAARRVAGGDQGRYEALTEKKEVKISIYLANMYLLPIFVPYL